MDDARQSFERFSHIYWAGISITLSINSLGKLKTFFGISRQSRIIKKYVKLTQFRQADRLHGAECSEQHGKAFDVGKIHGRFKYR